MCTRLKNISLFFGELLAIKFQHSWWTSLCFSPCLFIIIVFNSALTIGDLQEALLQFHYSSTPYHSINRFFCFSALCRSLRFIILLFQARLLSCSSPFAFTLIRHQNEVFDRVFQPSAQYSFFTCPRYFGESALFSHCFPESFAPIASHIPIFITLEVSVIIFCFPSVPRFSIYYSL